ncbi:MAG: hypothetical protein PF904_02025 [Kiritimatiellae bacterium]|nr:hypothetical protein [Kiritimatiellia bacterium]
MTKSSIDKLGDSLRLSLTDENLEKLDHYRRSFSPFYLEVVDKLRTILGVAVSGRPAKTTISICEKLFRSPMRLSQMADISGCRIVVPDMAAQIQVVDEIEHDKLILARFEGASLEDEKLIELLDKEFVFEMKENLKNEIRSMMSTIDDIKEIL